MVSNFEGILIIIAGIGTVALIVGIFHLCVKRKSKKSEKSKEIK